MPRNARSGQGRKGRSTGSRASRGRATTTRTTQRREPSEARIARREATSPPVPSTPRVRANGPAPRESSKTARGTDRGEPSPQLSTNHPAKEPRHPVYGPGTRPGERWSDPENPRARRDAARGAADDRGGNWDQEADRGVTRDHDFDALPERYGGRGRSPESWPGGRSIADRERGMGKRNGGDRSR